MTNITAENASSFYSYIQQLHFPVHTQPQQPTLLSLASSMQTVTWFIFSCVQTELFFLTAMTSADVMTNVRCYFDYVLLFCLNNIILQTLYIFRVCLFFIQCSFYFPASDCKCILFIDFVGNVSDHSCNKAYVYNHNPKVSLKPDIMGDAGSFRSV